MDFLDPRKKKTRTIRLMVGYFLMAIAIGLGTIVLVYGAYGYGIDTKTGQITENGLLFVDSKPGGASIFLNGADQKNTTSARMILNAGDYELALKKPGYREWRRSFTLDEHSIKRYVYPFLFPSQIVPKSVKEYQTTPQLITQTPDRRWLMVQNVATERDLNFDVYETGDPEQPSRQLSVPAAVMTGYNAATSKLVEVEWATDNEHLLLQHFTPSGNEFVVIDRTSPADSFNVNRLFNFNPSLAYLRDKKTGEFYLYDQQTRTLRIGDVGRKRLEAPLLNDVHAFKTYGENHISYVTSAGAPDGKMISRVWEEGRTYPLTTLNRGDKYFLDVARFQGNWYYVAVSNTDIRANIYKDPLEQVKSRQLKAPSPMVAFAVSGVNKVSFSANTRFLSVQAGQVFGVYDFEAEEKYQYEVPLSLSEPMSWMDGHRMIGNSNGTVVVMDYDSTNQQSLIPSNLPKGGYFDRDYDFFYTLAPSTGGAGLFRSDMRAGEDLPAELR